MMPHLLESRKTFWLLFLLCVGIRLYLFFNTLVIARDSVIYIAMAGAFIEGRFLEALKYVTPPVYPLLLAGMKLIVRDGEIAGKLVSFLAGTCAFFPLYYLGKRIFDQKVALIGLFFFSVHPYLARYSAEVLSESTFIFLSVTGLWLLWKGWEENQYFYSCLSGVLLGLSCLTRAQGFLWIGVIVILPPLLFLLRQRVDIENRSLWMPFMIALLPFFLTIFPYTYFLKELTGDWTVRIGGAKVIAKGTNLSGYHGTWGALIMLLGHPWILLKKLALNLLIFVRLFPATYHYPFLFFFVIGVLAKKDKKPHLPGELYLIVVCLTYIFAHSLLYPKVRYLLPVVPFALLWAGQGLLVAASRTNEFCVRHLPRFFHAQGLRFILVTLLCLSAAVALPKTLKPQGLGKLDRKEIGRRIASLSNQRPVILTTDARIGFYANASKIHGLPRIRDFDALMKYAQKKKVDIIVMDREMANNRKVGHVVRLFFENSTHPELQLLFTYPSQGTQELPRFYVYRLHSEENRSPR